MGEGEQIANKKNMLELWEAWQQSEILKHIET